MNQKGRDFFISPTKGKMTILGVVDDLVGFMMEEPENSYKLVIGTDSKSKKLKKPKDLDFVTAVIIHRQGKGGRYFWAKEKVGKVATLRDKIYNETFLSIQTAQKLVPLLKREVSGNSHNYQLEIHIDIGRNGPTREMIKEVVGMVSGNGYQAKIKPESYGAFSVADKHT
jgi:predicted RNase H-related nuclease YkuK (DUF458 family)